MYKLVDAKKVFDDRRYLEWCV